MRTLENSRNIGIPQAGFIISVFSDFTLHSHYRMSGIDANIMEFINDIFQSTKCCA